MKKAIAAATALLVAALLVHAARHGAGKKGERGGLRVVALAPSLCETVFALGAGDSLVGVTEFCDRPEEAKRIPRVGSMVSPSVERILMLRPDVVLATRTGGNRRETAAALERAGIRTLAVDDSSIEALGEAFARIGKLLGREREAERLRRSLEEAADEAARAAGRWKGKRAVWLVGFDPPFAAGRGTLYDDITARLGMANALEAGGWREVSAEWLLLSPPEVVFDISGAKPGEWKERLGAMPRGTAWLALPQDDLARPGPGLVRGLRKLARALEEAKPCR